MRFLVLPDGILRIVWDFFYCHFLLWQLFLL